MTQRKLHIAARAAGFAMVNQDSVDNQTQFFVRLDKDGSEVASLADPNRTGKQSGDQQTPSWSWLGSFSLRGNTA